MAEYFVTRARLGAEKGAYGGHVGSDGMTARQNDITSRQTCFSATELGVRFFASLTEEHKRGCDEGSERFRFRCIDVARGFVRWSFARANRLPEPADPFHRRVRRRRRKRSLCETRSTEMSGEYWFRCSDWQQRCCGWTHCRRIRRASAG